MHNPRFDDGRVVWRDENSGQYEQPTRGYSGQFELQWNIALKEKPDYTGNPGAATNDAHIGDRIYEWTGVLDMLEPTYNRVIRMDVIEG